MKKCVPTFASPNQGLPICQCCTLPVRLLRWCWLILTPKWFDSQMGKNWIPVQIHDIDWYWGSSFFEPSESPVQRLFLFFAEVNGKDIPSPIKKFEDSIPKTDPQARWLVSSIHIMSPYSGRCFSNSPKRDVEITSWYLANDCDVFGHVFGFAMFEVKRNHV